MISLKIIAYLSLALFSINTLASKQNTYLKEDLIAIAKNRCLPAQANNNTSSENNFFKTWFLDFDQMTLLSNESYRAPRNMSHKTYYNLADETFIMPYSGYLDQHKGIRLTNNFIISVIFHIEAALENNYTDYINFSDMGHSHFLIPEAYFESKIMPIQNMAEKYEKILSFEETKFFYHTAEQLQMVEMINDQIIWPNNDYLKHRYLTRNIIGDNKQTKKLEVVSVEHLEKQYNTVSNVEGYRWWGSGYYINANLNGCFPFKKAGNVYYFDIQLKPFYEWKDIDLHP